MYRAINPAAVSETDSNSFEVIAQFGAINNLQKCRKVTDYKSQIWTQYHFLEENG